MQLKKLTDTGEDLKLVHRRKRPKVDANIFDSELTHIRRLEASKKEKKIACPL